MSKFSQSKLLTISSTIRSATLINLINFQSLDLLETKNNEFIKAEISFKKENNNMQSLSIFYLAHEMMFGFYAQHVDTGSHCNLHQIN